MYKLSNCFHEFIDKAGGIEKFAQDENWNAKAIEDYISGDRKIQITTLVATAVLIEFRHCRRCPISIDDLKKTMLLLVEDKQKLEEQWEWLFPFN